MQTEVFGIVGHGNTQWKSEDKGQREHHLRGWNAAFQSVVSKSDLAPELAASGAWVVATDNAPQTPARETNPTPKLTPSRITSCAASFYLALLIFRRTSSFSFNKLIV